MLDDERRGVKETYLVASTSSSLRVQADRRGDSDIIIAAGWTESRVGMALLRLHSEWDRAQKPRKLTAEAIHALALMMPTEVEEDGVVWALPKTRRYELARQRAHLWYLGEMGSLVNKLTSLNGVRQQLISMISCDPSWRIDDAMHKVPEVIAYWLDQTCPQCHGLKFMQSPGSPSLSAKACKACAGTGVAPIPHGQEGRKIANYMDDCVSRAQSALRKRLRIMIPRA